MVGFRDNTEELYNAADIYCQPSRSEAMPNSIMEAMSCGLPIVASRVGAVSELVNAENSRLFAPGDSQGLARQLAELLTNRQSWPAMRDASLAMSQRFSAENMVEAYVALYQRMTAA
jgi:mannosyltransferase